MSSTDHGVGGFGHILQQHLSSSRLAADNLVSLPGQWAASLQTLCKGGWANRIVQAGEGRRRDDAGQCLSARPGQKPWSKAFGAQRPSIVISSHRSPFASITGSSTPNTTPAPANTTSPFPPSSPLPSPLPLSSTTISAPPPAISTSSLSVPTSSAIPPSPFPAPFPASQAPSAAAAASSSSVNAAAAAAKADLGRATWTLLHTLAAQLPERPSRQQQRDVAALVDCLTRVYPCGDCARHFAEMVRRDPPVVRSGSEFRRWLCGIHNRVNARLGKPSFNCELVEARWAPLSGCTAGAGGE
ncbi:hypothetical protein Agub_g14889, partial [Astrephomene gubernaculifera]